MNRKRQRDHGNGKNKAGNRAPTRHDLLCSLILAKAYMILAPRAGIEKAPPAILRFNQGWPDY